MLVREAGRAAGTAKLLDFGLATAPAGAPHAAPVETSFAETIAPSAVGTRVATSAPAFRGTVQYIAPELLEGRAADHRADIFAFGCVRYEMLAGRLG